MKAVVSLLYAYSKDTVFGISYVQTLVMTCMFTSSCEKG